LLGGKTVLVFGACAGKVFMTDTKQQSELEKDFWLFWGISPEGTPKHKAGLKALEFYRQHLTTIAKEAHNEYQFEKSADIKHGMWKVMTIINKHIHELGGKL
jgi:hypothetical protein